VKELWIEIPEELATTPKKELLTAASKTADLLVASSKDFTLVKAFNRPVAGTSNGVDIRIVEFKDPKDILLAKTVSEEIAARITIRSGEDEAKVIEAANLGARYTILRCPNWKTIPLENIIANTKKRSKIIMEVSNPEEAKLAIETLQLGADGVFFKTSSIEDVLAVGKIVKKSPTRIELTEAEVVSTKPLGTGARVCVDTCELMRPKEGILVGSQSSGLFLVESETIENPHVEPRPFRVNAGAVASYMLTSSERTRYLSELKAGDEVMIVDSEGNTRTTNVCRVKIEWRPMILIEATSQGRKFKSILQNAETVRLVTTDASKSITEIKPGDKVLMRTEMGGRHFGTKVDEESVIER